MSSGRTELGSSPKRGMSPSHAPDSGSELVAVSVVGTAPPLTQQVKTPVESTIESLKAIVTIIMGLTVPAALVLLLDPVTSGTVTVLLVVEEVVSSVVLIGNVFRFYIGNNRHLDDMHRAHVLRSRGVPFRGTRERLGLDSMVIFLESVILAAMGLYLRVLVVFFLLYAFLLLVDIIWIGGGYDLAGQADKSEADYLKKWFVNNGVCFLILVVALAIDLSQNLSHMQAFHVHLKDPGIVLFSCLAVVGLANVVFDFVGSWQKYFPSLREVPAGGD
ncbi:MAG TPA: hypothetical protein VHA57_04815 [Actinomycetota bacterium]|nr:hypothetical protein [Actinomycetota bacterium]